MSRGPSQNRGLVHGIGRNDALYVVSKIVSGKRVTCPYYVAWTEMLKRCYSENYQRKRPTYRGCSVVEPWLQFMTFRSWMSTQNWEGKALDKDILIVGNKVYGPTTCKFVSYRVNGLLLDSLAKRGEYATGVHLRKDTGKFRAYVQQGTRKLKHLGQYDTEEEARSAYIEAKVEIILQVASEQDDLDVKAALRNHAEILQHSGDNL